MRDWICIGGTPGARDYDCLDLSETIAALASAPPDELLMRIETPDTRTLAAFERALNEQATSLREAPAKLADAIRPSFTWWAFGGLWAHPAGGWTILLRRQVFHGVAQHAPLVANGRR